MQSFKEFFTQDELIATVTSLKEKNEDNIEDSEVFYNAIDQFLTVNNLKNPFLNHKNYETNLGYKWNAYINGKLNKSETANLFHNFFYKIIIRSFSMNNDDIEKTYNQIISTFDSGNFNQYELPEMYDFQKGKTFNVDFKNWVPRLLQFVPGPDWKSCSYILAPDIDVQNYVEKDIEFKTGNLLVADWFRIPEFNALVNTNELHFDVNSNEGRLQQSIHYLNNFNFISNTSYYNSTILQKNDEYIFGYYNDEHSLPSEYKEKGYVSKELRAISIIEKEHLEDLVGVKAVEDLLSNQDITPLKVTPGIYKVCLSSSSEYLKKNWKDIGLEDDENNLSTFIEKEYLIPALVLKGIDIKPENKKRKKIKY